MGFVRFAVISAALGSGLFSLGGLTIIYLKYRTAIAKIACTFIVSLALLSLGLWLRSLLSYFGQAPGLAAAAGATALIGMVLNIAIVPRMAAALLSDSIHGWLGPVLTVWTIAAASAAVAYPFIRRGGLILAFLDAQLVSTIAVAVAVLAYKAPSLKRKDHRNSLIAFVAVSAAFLVLLSLDMLIERLHIEALKPLDGLSLPAYLIVLNAGIFAYASSYLGAEALSRSGKLTDSCKTRFGLTPREAEIIEILLGGRTNQEIADALFISRKTVENHLYNVFQKMGVANRVQLIGTLGLWKAEH